MNLNEVVENTLLTITEGTLPGKVKDPLYDRSPYLIQIAQKHQEKINRGLYQAQSWVAEGMIGMGMALYPGSDTVNAAGAIIVLDSLRRMYPALSRTLPELAKQSYRKIIEKAN
jgi:hypothetical protein